MSDYRTGTSRLGAAIGRRRSGTGNTGRGAYDLRAQEMKYEIQLLDILRKLKANADDRAAKLELESIRAEIKLFEIQQRRAIESDKITAANYQTKFKEIRKDIRDTATHRKNYALKFASSYDAIDRLMIDKLRDTKAITGRNKVAEIWAAFGEGESVASKSVKGYNQQDPRFLGTFEKAAELSNSASLKSLFKKDKDNKYVLDEAVANDLNIDSNSEIYQRIKSKMEAYNKGVASDVTYKDASNDALAEADQLLAAAEADFLAGKEESGRGKLEAYKSMQSKAESAFNIKHGVGDPGENQRILDRETEDGNLYKMVEGLLGAAGKKSPTRRENDAITIGDSDFQQWARDNGYDAIGKVYVDEDGSKRYVSGGDDTVALFRFSKEQDRAPGDYGANPGGTGEIVDVNILDDEGNPQVIRGERLRIHAADPWGMVRVNTKDGVVALPRDKMTALTVIHRPSVGQTLGDKLASGNWFGKTFDDFSDLSYRGKIEGLARTADGMFVISEDGSPMTQEQYDEARSVLAAEAGLKIVNIGKPGDPSGGQEYLYFGNDENGVGVYQEIEGKSNVLKPVTEFELRKDLDNLPKRAAFIRSTTGNKSVGLLTKDAISTVEIGGVKQFKVSNYGVSSLSGDLDDEGELVTEAELLADKGTLADAVKGPREKITAGDLKGVTTTSQAPVKGDEFKIKEIRTVASTPWSELIKPEIEPEPEEEPEEGLTGEQRRAARQAGRKAKRIGRTLEKAQPEFEQLSESAQLAEMGLDPTKYTPEAIEAAEREGMKLGRQTRHAKLLDVLGKVNSKRPEDIEAAELAGVGALSNVRQNREARKKKRFDRRGQRAADDVESDSKVSNQTVPTSGMGKVTV